MHACGYETASTRIRSGAIVISRLGVPPGRHALDIEPVGLATGQLDRLPSRDEYKKVIRCDTCSLMDIYYLFNYTCISMKITDPTEEHHNSIVQDYISLYFL